MTFASQASGNLTLSGTNIFLNESFSDPSVLSQWSFGKSNAHAANPTFVDGTLRLTSAETDQGSFVLYNKGFSAQDGLTVTFDTYAYGGNGADGISWFLVDGKQSPTQAGSYGGSLGYASSVYHHQPGIAGGYLGVGLDSYGNFSNPADSAAGGPGLTPDSIAVRGSEANGYRYLTGTGSLPTSLDVPGAPSRDQAKRSVQIDLSKTGLLNVYVDLNADGDFLDGGEKAINNFNVVAANGALPDTLKFGFAASTGCSTNIHEIDNLVVKVGGTHQPPNPPIPPIPPIPPVPPTPPNPPIPPVPPTPPNPPIPPVPPTPPNPPIPPVPPTPPNPPIPPIPPTPPTPPSGLEIRLENRSFTYVENAAPTSPVSLTISGNGAISQAQVQLGTGFNANQDRLTILNQSGTSGQISGLNWSYSNGLLTITGNGSAQDYQTALQSVVYQNLSDNPSTDNRTIVYTISGNGFSTQSSQSFSVQSVDDGPVFTVPGNLSVQAGSAGALIAGIDFTDADTPVSNYQLRVVDAQGNVDSRFVIENGQLKLASGQSLSITDSPITLRILADAGAGNIFLSDLLTILISGGGTVQIPGLGTPVTYTEDDGPRSIANLLILEGDAGLVIDQATVRIRDNYSAGQDRLSVDGVTGTSGTTNGLNWTYDAATGTLTFTGNAAPAVYQTALRLVTYSNSSQNPSTAPRSILYTIGGGATPLGTGLATVTVQGVDDLGILTLPQTASIPSGISGAVVGSIAVEDVDTTYTFTVDDDRFEIVNGQLRLKAGQSIAGATSIPLVITATGNAPGVVLTAPLNISVIAGGLAIGGLGAGASYTEDGAPIPLASGLTLAGGAAGTPISGAQVSLTGFVASQDQLGIAGAPAGVNSGTIAGTGISWTYAPGIGVLNFTGDGSAADYQATLRQVVYSNSSQNPSTAARTAQYTIGSGTGAGVGSLPLTVIAVNDPPTGITLTPAPGPIGVGGTIGTIAVQDPDSTTFTYTFTVNGQPDNRFEIVPGPNGTQVLRLRAGQSLTGPVSLTIGANDGGTPAGTTAQVFQLNPGSTITPIPQSDVIFFDEAGTRKVKVWTVNAANQVVNSANLQNPLTLSDWVLPANWFFLKTGDFDGNGAADILWKDTAGDLQIWYLRPDGTFLGSVPVTLGTTGNRVQIPATTQVVGLANMTADTNLDIVTYDSVTGRSQIWALNGLSNVIGGAPITVSDATGPVSTGPGWEALDLADFDADGDADILFVNRAAGTISVWRLNGTQFVGATGLGTPTATGFPALPASYQFGTTGDFTGDGRTDIIWRVNGGDPVLWQVTDNGTAFSAVQTTLPNVDPGWQLGGAGRFNADTTADVVWRNVNPNIGQVLWTFNNGVPTPSVFTYNGVPGTTPGATALLTDSPTWKIFGLGDYAAVSAAPVTPPTPITP